MSVIVRRVLGLVLVLLLAWWAIAALLPVTGGRLVHALPFPVACAGIRCVTLRTWSETMRRVSAEHSRETPEAVLTALLSERAARTVARRAGVVVTGDDVERVLATLDSVAEETAGLRELLGRHYGDRLESPKFRERFADVLLREKLRAAGVENVWAHSASPSVSIFHMRYRWDGKRHAVQLR